MEGIKYMAKSMFDIIKKQNGEKFAKEIRDTDSRIFEIENLAEILKYAGRNPENLIPFLRGLLKVEEDVQTEKIEDPFTLLKQAGYNAFYANTLKKQNSIQKYFDKSEELCTFRDPDRYKDYYIIHAVKENVDQIRRKDFLYPERQDAYGTSVISIQIVKEGGFISIKNRYNHSVLMADATFESNPDNIIKGLSASLKKYFNVDFKTSPVAKLPNGFTYQNGCLYKYNDELNNYYFGDGFYLKDGVVTELKKDYQFFVGHYLFDLKEKTITNFVESSKQKDPFVPILNEELKGKRIQKKMVNGAIHLYLDDEIFLKTNEKHEAKEITFFKAEELPSGAFRNILTHAISLTAPNLRKIGSYCCSGPFWTKVDTPKLEEMGDNNFSCMDMKVISFPHLKKMGQRCLSFSPTVKRMYLPELKEVGANSISYNLHLEKVNLKSAERISKGALVSNRSLKRIWAPQVKVIDSEALCDNDALERLYLMRLEKVGAKAISFNPKLKKVWAPRLEKGGIFCLSENAFGCYVSAKNLKELQIGSLKNGARLYAPLLKNTDFIVNKLHKRMVQSHLCVKKYDSYFDILSFMGLKSHKKEQQRSIG